MNGIMGIAFKRVFRSGLVVQTTHLRLRVIIDPGPLQLLHESSELQQSVSPPA